VTILISNFTFTQVGWNIVRALLLVVIFSPNYRVKGANSFIRSC